jgi:excisionase family DNA binding protein
MNPIFLSRHKAATALGIGVSTLDKLTASGQIKATRIGDRVFFTYAELQRFADDKVTQ